MTCMTIQNKASVEFSIDKRFFIYLIRISENKNEWKIVYISMNQSIEYYHSEGRIQLRSSSEFQSGMLSVRGVESASTAGGIWDDLHQPFL